MEALIKKKNKEIRILKETCEILSDSKTMDSIRKSLNDFSKGNFKKLSDL